MPVRREVAREGEGKRQRCWMCSRSGLGHGTPQLCRSCREGDGGREEGKKRGSRERGGGEQVRGVCEG